MDAKLMFWIGFLSTCMISTTVDSVIPDYMRNRGRMTTIRRKPTPFRPNHKKCCNIGKKCARKRMSCTVTAAPTKRSNTVAEQLNRTRPSKRYTQNFQGKVEQCAIGPFSRMFEKCCSYRENLYKEIKRCRLLHKRRVDRKKCKRDVKRRYS